MPGLPRWSYYTPQVWAVVGDVEVAVASVQVDFGLNTIPQCQITLPVGRDGRFGTQVAAIHSLVAGLSEQVRVRVFARLTPHDQSDASVRALGVPDGEFQIFEGLSCGGGYSRGYNSARYVLAANHWLVQLTQGSAFSDSSHPGNPARFSYGALQPSGADTGALDWTVLTQAHKFVTQENLAKDLWGKALYPWFQSLASKDGFWVREKNLQGEGSNRQAEAALSRMTPGGNCYAPLRPRPDLEIDVDVADQIANDVSRLSADPEFVAHQTLWDILVGKFAPDYLFAVVPRVKNALVVPYITGYRGAGGKPFASILAGEYDQSSANMMMPRPLRAYGILSGLATRSGASGFNDDAPSDAAMGVGGWFDTKKAGSVIVGQAPRWLSSIMNPSRYSAASSGGDLKPIANAQHPDAGAANTAREDAKKRAVDTVKPLLDAYAKARYAQEILKGRFTVVGGALRFDIAPGSLVRLEGASEAFIAESDQLGQAYFGEVLRVSLTIDAEAPAAGTALHIGQVRTAKENGDDRTSVKEHPVYESTYAGCALIDP